MGFLRSIHAAAWKPMFHNNEYVNGVEISWGSHCVQVGNPDYGEMSDVTLWHVVVVCFDDPRFVRFALNIVRNKASSDPEYVTHLLQVVEQLAYELLRPEHKGLVIIQAPDELLLKLLACIDNEKLEDEVCDELKRYVIVWVDEVFPPLDVAEIWIEHNYPPVVRLKEEIERLKDKSLRLRDEIEYVSRRIRVIEAMLNEPTLGEQQRRELLKELRELKEELRRLSEEQTRIGDMIDELEAEFQEKLEEGFAHLPPELSHPEVIDIYAWIRGKRLEGKEAFELVKHLLPEWEYKKLMEKFEKKEEMVETLAT